MRKFTKPLVGKSHNMHFLVNNEIQIHSESND